MDKIRFVIGFVVLGLWVALAVHLILSCDKSLRIKASVAAGEHEKTREVLGRKIEKVEKLLTAKQAEDAKELVKVAKKHVDILTKVSSTTEDFRVSLHSTSKWSRESDLLVKGPAPPRGREGAQAVIDYYSRQTSALIEVLGGE